MNRRLKTFFDHFEEIIASIFILITTILVLVNIFLRYVLKAGIYWSNEVATICFVWSVFIGAAGAYRRGMHIGVDMVVKKLPPSVRKIVNILVQIILLLVNGYIFIISIIFVRHSYIKPTQVLGVSSAWVSVCLIVSFALTTLYSALNLKNCLKSAAIRKEA